MIIIAVFITTGMFLFTRSILTAIKVPDEALPKRSGI